MLKPDDISAHQERLHELSHQLYKALAKAWLELSRYQTVSVPTYETFRARVQALRDLLDDLEADMEMTNEPY